MIEGLTGRPGARHADELGRHDAARGIRRINQEPLDGVAGFGVEAREQLGARRVGQPPEDVGGAVRRHRAEQAAGLSRFEARDDVGGEIEFRLIEHLDRAFRRQPRENRRADIRLQAVKRLDIVRHVLLQHRGRNTGGIGRLFESEGVFHGSPDTVRRQRPPMSRPGWSGHGRR